MMKKTIERELHLENSPEDLPFRLEKYMLECKKNTKDKEGPMVQSSITFGHYKVPRSSIRHHVVGRSIEKKLAPRIILSNDEEQKYVITLASWYNRIIQ